MFLLQLTNLHILFRGHVSEKERKKLSIKLTPKDIRWPRFLEKVNNKNNLHLLIKTLERCSFLRILKTFALGLVLPHSGS